MMVLENAKREKIGKWTWATIAIFKMYFQIKHVNKYTKR